MIVCTSCWSVESEIIYTVQDGPDDYCEQSYCYQCKDTECFKEMDEKDYLEEQIQAEADKKNSLRKDE